MITEYLALKKELVDFIMKPDSTDNEFNTMALKVFQFQYEYNQPFRKFCRKRRVSPRTVKYFTDIPPVPIDAFKLTTLSSFPIEETESLFMTSGTTNPEKRGKNYHRDLEIYDLSMKVHFKSFVMPDLDKMKMFILFPKESELPNSSLAHYLHIAKEHFGTEESKYAMSSNGFEFGSFIEQLQFAEKNEEPILLIGATFSFIHLLDECKKKNISFNLPPNSRMMDTGGAKGRSRELDPKQFKQEMCQLFSLPVEMCVNMYGMTELSSQFYDRNLYDYFEQQQISTLKKAPHWVRTLVLDIERMEEKTKGEKGIIVHYDLANINSVMSILTEDVGIHEEGGFQLLGRAKGAEAKGCSLAVEQFLASSQRSRGEQ
ncbi:long-chain fatty acid--CoA ligase [Alkalihalobacillus sp. BA299]|uniref:LuxE/PaaK family acyltransferase n=1 Tax=Alkalihalobacillus sp. BA299 TaxID=2815938 RepID=UPI001FFE04DD|nr:long-chain fatty acid--CoA ligase [Alkalihalobacillus sp. BA299]